MEWGETMISSREKLHPERFEKFRTEVFSLRLLKPHERESGDEFREQSEKAERDLHILELGFRDPDYIADAIRISDTLTSLLPFTKSGRLKTEVKKICGRNFRILEKTADGDDLFLKIRALNIAARLEGKKSSQLLEKKIDYLINGYRESLQPENKEPFQFYIEPLVKLAENGRGHARDQAREALMRSFYNPDFNPNCRDPNFRFGFATEAITRRLWGDGFPKLNEMIQTALEEYGFDYADYRLKCFGQKKQAPEKYHFRYTEDAALRLEKAGQIEAKRPGITRQYIKALQENLYQNKVRTDDFVQAIDNYYTRGDMYHSAREELADITDLNRKQIDKFIDSWKQDGKISFIRGLEYAEKNLQAVSKLEAEIPGICRILNKEFNICDFARYPKRLMLEQYRLRDNGDIPYGIAIYPYLDWNGAFYLDRETLDKFHGQLDGRYTLRVVEARMVSDAVKSLIRFNKRYAARISFALVAGHGKRDGIEFSGADNRILLSEHLTGPGGARIADFFVPNPTVILESCSTGAKKGIGQVLSRVLKAHVIAPTIPTSLTSLNAEYDKSGQLKLSAEYAGRNSKSHYSAGRRDE